MPRSRKDLLGRKFGSLTVLGGYINERDGSERLLLCRCDCGKDCYSTHSLLLTHRMWCCWACQRAAELQAIREGIREAALNRLFDHVY